jgi:ubiquinone/menaquinone biosynthesis C-methylase UbiE
MELNEAINLIEKGITDKKSQQWADLGCGRGTFTMALTHLLANGSYIYAVDKKKQDFQKGQSGVVPVQFLLADFEHQDMALPALDGIMMANSLHFIKDKRKLIQRLEHYFSGNSTFLIIEYNSRNASPWVPYPINYQQLENLFIELGYHTTSKLAELPSKFGGSLYAALITFRELR